MCSQASIRFTMPQRCCTEQARVAREREWRVALPVAAGAVGALLLYACVMVARRPDLGGPWALLATISASAAGPGLGHGAHAASAAALAKVKLAAAAKSAGKAGDARSTAHRGRYPAENEGAAAKLPAKPAKVVCVKGWSGPHCEVHGTWGGPPLQIGQRAAGLPAPRPANRCLPGWRGPKCNIKSSEWESKKNRSLQRISDSMAAMARQMDSDPDKKMLAQIAHKIGELQRKVDEARREASGGPRRLTAAKSKSRRRRPSPPAPVTTEEGEPESVGEGGDGAQENVGEGGGSAGGGGAAEPGAAQEDTSGRRQDGTPHHAWFHSPDEGAGWADARLGRHGDMQDGYYGPQTAYDGYYQTGGANYDGYGPNWNTGDAQAAWPGHQSMGDDGRYQVRRPAAPGLRRCARAYSPRGGGERGAGGVQTGGAAYASPHDDYELHRQWSSSRPPPSVPPAPPASAASTPPPPPGPRTSGRCTTGTTGQPQIRRGASSPMRRCGSTTRPSSRPTTTRATWRTTTRRTLGRGVAPDRRMPARGALCRESWWQQSGIECGAGRARRIHSCAII